MFVWKGGHLGSVQCRAGGWIVEAVLVESRAAADVGRFEEHGVCCER